MNKKSMNSILRELDACQSYFQVLNTVLESNIIVRDFHALAVLAKSGSDRIDDIIDHLDEMNTCGRA